jgi:hypothetical protein
MTSILRTLALSLASHYSTDELMMVLIDFQRRLADYGGKYSLGQIPHVVQVVSRAEQLDDLLLNLQVEAKDFAATPNRKKLFMMIDNYDSFTDEGNKKNRKAFEEMAVIAREYGTAGLHFVASGSLAMLSATEDLRKQIQASNYGLALQTADAVTRLNGKAPRSLQDAELPPGRAFIVKSGRTMMIQAATPYSSDDNIEGSLDTWVEQILTKSRGAKAAWMRSPDEAPTGSEQPAAQPQHDPARIEAMKAKLRTKGMVDALLNSMSPDDIIKMATRYGFDSEKPEGQPA